MKPLLATLHCMLPLCAAVLLTSCASPMKIAESYAAQDEWMKAVVTYRKYCSQRPCDVEYRSRLKQTELKAADFFYQRGLREEEAGNFDAALAQFQQGLIALPEHNRLQQAVAEVVARKQAEEFYEEGVTFRNAGKYAEARRQLEKALDLYPWHKAASELLTAIKAEEENRFSEGLALSSSAPVTLNFRQTDLKQAFEFLAKSFGVNVIFDEGTKSVPVTLFGKDVTFDQGLNLLLATTKSFYKRIGPNTILIAPDTKEKRGQYEDHLVRTYQLNVVRAKDMAEILKGLLNVKKVSINESLNTLEIRDTEDVVKLAEHIVESNDRKPAEIILDVEILEVNRNKSDKLGLDLGTYSVVGSIGSTSGTIPITGSIRNSIVSNTVLTLPTATFRFFKQDVDAKTLSNPKIRVTSGKSAKIHVGDRVPLLAANIVDATGQTRTTYDYKDIGIQLAVEPLVNLDNSTSVKLSLEVSSLGANIGTAAQPAYAIGTRKAETYMVLRDGETAILGGLIQDQSNDTRTKVPGIGDIPGVGSLVTSYDQSGSRTDVLLTITPRVVRGWDVPARPLREFYSGTETVYSDKPIFGSLTSVARQDANAPAGKTPREGGATEPADEPRTGSSGNGPPGSPVPKSPPDTNTATDKKQGPDNNPTPDGKSATDGKPSPDTSNSGAAAPASPTLSFDQPVYDVTNGQQVDIDVIGAGLPAGSNAPLEILYNSKLLTYVSGSKGDVGTADVTADSARGVISIALSLASGASNSNGSTVAHLSLRGLKPGVSYLVFRTPSLKDSNGESVSTQVRASRIVVK
jgi:general secretion pathway protein D